MNSIHELIKVAFNKEYQSKFDPKGLPEWTNSQVLFLWALVFPAWRTALEEGNVMPPEPIMEEIVAILESDKRYEKYSNIDDSKDEWGFEQIRGVSDIKTFLYTFWAYPDDGSQWAVKIGTDSSGRMDPSTLSFDMEQGPNEEDDE